MVFWRKITLQGQEILATIEYRIATVILVDFDYEKYKESYTIIEKYLEKSSNHFLSPYTEKIIFRWNISPHFWHRDYVCSVFCIKHDRLLPLPKDGIHPGNLGPFSKKRKTILFASNPARGLKPLVKIFSNLIKKDPEFVLHACVPERARGYKFKTEPNSLLSRLLRRRDPKNSLLYNYGACDNLCYHSYLPPYQQEHWQLFKMCEYLVYPSTFTEPSSRVVTHARGAGCVILYPPDMGSPSDFLTHNVDAIVTKPEKMIDQILYLEEHPDAKAKLVANSIEAASRYTFENQVKSFTNYLTTYINKANK